jgi:hypothetical protein
MAALRLSKYDLGHIRSDIRNDFPILVVYQFELGSYRFGTPFNVWLPEI